MHEGLSDFRKEIIFLLDNLTPFFVNVYYPTKGFVMGAINYQPSIEDDYSAEVIRLSMERSPEIDAWFVEQRYLSEALEESLTPLWFRNRCIVKICQELNQMGVRINRDLDELCEQPPVVYGILALRKKLDEDTLFETMRDHRDLFEVIAISMDDDPFRRYLDWCIEWLRLDEGWELVRQMEELYSGIIEGDTVEFVQHLKIAVDRVDDLGIPDVTSEVDEATMFKFVRILGKRVEFIKKIADTLWANAAENEYKRTARRAMVNNALDGTFEVELGSRDNLKRNAAKLEALDLNNSDAVREFIASARTPYLKRWNHCLEYYCVDEVRQCPTSVQVIMVATLIADVSNRLNLEAEITDKIMSYEDRLGTDAVNKIVDVFKSMLVNMVEPMELNYNEA